MAKPTPEMVEFTKEAVRVSALNRHGLTTDDDMQKLTDLGTAAQTSQTEANRRG